MKKSFVWMILASGLCACSRQSSLDFGRGLDVPYVQTPLAVVQSMMVMAKVSNSDVVIDLGCGDGRIAIAAARLGARSLGYDLDPDRIAESRENARRQGVSGRTTFIQQDLFRSPISEASVVTMFLLPSVIERLEPRLRSELAPGTRVVSHSFPIRGWSVAQTLHIEGRTLYLYLVPPREPLLR